MVRKIGMVFTLVLTLGLVFNTTVYSEYDPLPSWNNTDTKKKIIDFVNDVTSQSSPNFVSELERFAVFDNDGTLWAEKPAYFQQAFLLHRIDESAEENPELKNRQPFKAALTRDYAYLKKIDKKLLNKLYLMTHTGMSQKEFEQKVKIFLRTAKHPTLKRRYTELVYQPMLELMDYLRDNQFKVYICSGGGTDFIRSFSYEVYKVPKENVIGTTFQYEYKEGKNGGYIYRKQDFVEPINLKGGKPVNIQRRIGTSPIFTFGNSNGDISMMRFAAIGNRPYLNLTLSHDDEKREFKYDQGAKVMQEISGKGNWLTVSMKKDFKVVFPFQK